MANAVKVVEHQIERFRQVFQIVEQRIYHRLQRPTDLALQQRRGATAEAGTGGGNRRHQILQKPRRFAITFIARQPGAPCPLPLQAATQLAKDSALAKAGGCAEHDQALLAGVQQTLEQGRAFQQWCALGMGGIQLGTQQRHSGLAGRILAIHDSSRLSSRARRMA